MPRPTRPTRRRLTGPALLTATAAVLAGCTTSQPPPNQRVLHYSAGAYSATNFVKCVDPGTYSQDGASDLHYGYPTDLRSFEASPDRDAERPPFTTVSKDNAEMSQPAVLTFTLNTDCRVLRLFHENQGIKYGAGVTSDDEQPGDGWRRWLLFAFSQVLDTTLDRVEQEHAWRDLWNNPAVKAQVEAAVERQLPDLIWQHLGSARITKDGKLSSNPRDKRVDYVQGLNLTLLKPEPTNPDLRSSVAAEQAAVARANSAEKQAAADVAAANAQLAVARADAAKLRAGLDALGADLWLRKYQLDRDHELKDRAIDKGINPWPSPVIPGVVAPTGQ